MVEVYSIGHSDLEVDRFIELLRKWNITAIADVRSSPFSRRSPWFNHDELRMELAFNSIRYVYLGRELGGRPSDDDLFDSGVASYPKMADRPEYLEGIRRVLAGAEEYRIALMCSERDPLHCHRCLLVGRSLEKAKAHVCHILHSGQMETQAEAETRMVAEEGLDSDLLLDRTGRVKEAYRRRNQRYAYSRGEASKWKKYR